MKVNPENILPECLTCKAEVVKACKSTNCIFWSLLCLCCYIIPEIKLGTTCHYCNLTIPYCSDHNKYLMNVRITMNEIYYACNDCNKKCEMCKEVQVNLKSCFICNKYQCASCGYFSEVLIMSDSESNHSYNICRQCYPMNGTEIERSDLIQRVIYLLELKNKHEKIMKELSDSFSLNVNPLDLITQYNE
jgi:hypothetical protein